MSDEHKTSMHQLTTQKNRINRQLRQMIRDNSQETSVRGGFCSVCFSIKESGKCCSRCRKYFCDDCIANCPPDICAFCRSANTVTQTVRFN